MSRVVGLTLFLATVLCGALPGCHGSAPPKSGASTARADETSEGGKDNSALPQEENGEEGAVQAPGSRRAAPSEALQICKFPGRDRVGICDTLWSMFEDPRRESVPSFEPGAKERLAALSRRTSGGTQADATQLRTLVHAHFPVQYHAQRQCMGAIFEGRDHREQAKLAAETRASFARIAPLQAARVGSSAEAAELLLFIGLAHLADGRGNEARTAFEKVVALGDSFYSELAQVNLINVVRLTDARLAEQQFAAISPPQGNPARGSGRRGRIGEERFAYSRCIAGELALRNEAPERAEQYFSEFLTWSDSRQRSGEAGARSYYKIVERKLQEVRQSMGSSLEPDE